MSDVFLPSIHAGAHLFDEVTGDVFIVFHHLVDDAIRREFDDAVGDGLDELVVVTAEEDVALIEFQVVVECLDALKVEMVGGGTRYGGCSSSVTADMLSAANEH